VRVLSTSVHGLEMPVGECSALVLPVVRVPSCARGRPGVLFTAHLHMYNKSVLQYCRYIKNDDHHHHHEPRTKFHLIERMVAQVDYHIRAEQSIHGKETTEYIHSLA